MGEGHSVGGLKIGVLLRGFTDVRAGVLITILLEEGNGNNRGLRGIYAGNRMFEYGFLLGKTGREQGRPGTLAMLWRVEEGGQGGPPAGDALH